MTEKRGRPTLNPKKSTLRARIDQETEDDLATCQELTGMNQSEIVRRGIELVKLEALNINPQFDELTKKKKK